MFFTQFSSTEDWKNTQTLWNQDTIEGVAQGHLVVRGDWTPAGTGNQTCNFCGTIPTPLLSTIIPVLGYLTVARTDNFQNKDI